MQGQELHVTATDSNLLHVPQLSVNAGAASERLR